MHSDEAGLADFVASLGDASAVRADWGQLNWLVSDKAMPGAEQTLGVVTIYPGKRNPLHSHPNCEELLYVVSGRCEHLLGEEKCELAAGNVIRIPRGIRHWARCTSAEPLVAVISFSSGVRLTEAHEGDALA
jgi:quercetin dioxygenase-like cupin family protein